MWNHMLSTTTILHTAGRQTLKRKEREVLDGSGAVIPISEDLG